MPDVHQIIATMNPDLYYKTSDDKGEAKKELQKFKELIKEVGFQKAAEKAKPKPLESHLLLYDSSSETLEPIYFFVIDLMSDFGLSPEKLLDNFTSSPGSGHFSELGQRATVMQQQASKVLGDINNVMRSILNLVYDLKEFKIRLQAYKDLKSSDDAKKESAMLALKQIWMDKVDINKGNSSLKAMAFGGQVGFQTLVDAFLFVKDEKAADKVDLNDRVKRIVKQRIHEFNLWLTESEIELTKRYEMERKYLKSQVNSVKLYSRWAKPYLRSALQLEMKDRSKEVDLIKAFNSILLELTVLGKTKVNIGSAVFSENLPQEFSKLPPPKRDYVSCIIVDFRFKGIPQKTSPYQQHYVFGGRVEVTLSAYALNSDEIALMKKELEKADIGDALQLMQGATEGSLEEMQKDIDEFLNEEEIAEKKEKAKPKDTSNPFAAMFGFYDKKEKPVAAKKPESEEKIRPDSYLEKTHLRPLAADTAKGITFTLFDVYKKAHNMPSYT